MSVFSNSMLCSIGTKPPAFKSLATLFAGGADGIMIDFTNKDTLFQNANGAVEVVNNGDPVGLALDQHKWGGKTLAAYRAAQPEKVTNAEFTSDVTGWNALHGTLIWEAGAAKLTAIGTANQPVMRGNVIPTISGRWYEITVELESITGGGSFNWAILAGNVAGGTSLLVSSISSTSAGSYRRFIKAVSTTTYISVAGRGGAGGGGTITKFSSVSVKEIDGHHATQTSTARPTWASATGDVVFNGSAYLSTDFYFASNNNFYSAWFNGLGSAETARIILGAYDSSPTAQAYLGQSGATGLALIAVGSYGLGNATSIVGTTGTLLADQTASLAEGFLNGVKFGQQTTPGDLPDIADSVPVWIGTRNQNGAASLSMVGNLKRVVCGQISLQSQMSAADFHANLIAT